MDPGSVAAIIVSVVAAGGAYLSQKAAAKASKVNTEAGGRIKMEDEAYERARNMDVATISRQDIEITQLTTQNDLLKLENEQLRVVREQNGYLNADVKRISKDNERILEENDDLKAKVAELEAKVKQLERQQPHTSEEYYNGNE